MSDEPDPPRKRRRVTRRGSERPYMDPTPDDEPEPDTQGGSSHDEWLKAQKPPHHG